MSFSDHKITQFTHRISELADQPNMPADELKARFDSSPEELRQSVNGICDDAARLEARVEGIVVETDREHYTLQPYVLLPDMNSDEITDSLIDEHYYTIMPISLGLDVSGADSSVTTLMTTSDTSFSKIAGYDLATYEKEDGDIDGPFAVAVSVDCDNEGQIVWFTSSAFLEDMYNAFSSGANSDLAMNALSSLIGEREAMAIRSKSLNYNYLNISSSTASLLKVLMIGVFPLAYLGIGIGVILRRRRLQNEAG